MTAADLDSKLNEVFLGKVVRKDLLLHVKKGTNVPSFVLEFLLARYCASDDPREIQEGMAAVLETIQKNYIMADCCHPIPGDDVLGYIDEQNRIIIHKRQCPVAARLKSSYGNRIIATEWDTHKELSFLVTIYLKGIDSMGLLNEVTQVISRQLNVNIRKLTIETTDGIFEGKIQLYVHDVDDVRSICDNLKQIQNIKQVTRIEG